MHLLMIYDSAMPIYSCWIAPAVSVILIQRPVYVDPSYLLLILKHNRDTRYVNSCLTSKFEKQFQLC